MSTSHTAVYEPAGEEERTSTFPSSSMGCEWLMRPVRAEDTFVLLDALEADADAIRDLAPRICLEIGRVGSVPTTVVCSRRRTFL